MQDVGRRQSRMKGCVHLLVVVWLLPTAAMAAAATPTSPAPVTTTLKTVNVTASSLLADLGSHQWLTPGTIGVLDGNDFRQRAVTSMTDALRYAPGVYMQSNTGGQDQVLSIRGSNLTALNYDNSGVLLLVDGLPVTTADGANHNRLMNPLSARRIVVANGANALTYGATTLGGAINFVTRTARNSHPNQLTLSAGENGRADMRISTGGVAGDLDGMVTVSSQHFSGYQQHSRNNRSSVNANVGWRASDDLHLRLYATAIDSHQRLAGSLTRAQYHADPRSADPSYVLGDHQLNVKTGRLAATAKWRINQDSHMDFGVSWEVESLYHPIVDVYDFSQVPPAHGFSLLINTSQRTGGAMARYHLRAGAHHILAGVNLAYTHDQGGNFVNDQGQRGAKTDAIDQKANSATAFVMDRWEFAPEWTLVYGAQGVSTHRNVRDVTLATGAVRDQRHTYASINPRIGLLRQLGDNAEAFASVSRLYEAPDNFELNNDVRKDDSVLKATQGLSGEIGVRGQGAAAASGKQWRWSVSSYYARLRNEVLSVEDPTQPGNMLSGNYAHTVHAGLEAAASAEWPLGVGGSRLAPLVSASWNAFSFHRDPTFHNNRLPEAPTYQVHGEMLYRYVPWGFYAGPTLTLAGAKYADMAHTYRVGAYALFGLRVGLERARWSLFLQADNLTNKRYVNAVTPLTMAGADARVLNAGAPRQLFVGFNLRY